MAEKSDSTELVQRVGNVEEYLQERSLDELLNEAEQERCKLIMPEKTNKKGEIVENNMELVAITEKYFLPSKYGFFADIIKRASDIEELFYARSDILPILNKVVGFLGFLESIDRPNQSADSSRIFRDNRNNFVDSFREAGLSYLHDIKDESKMDLVIGRKVRTIFVPCNELGIGAKEINNSIRYTDYREYFNERNKNFPPGSIGKIIGFEDSSALVEFDKEGKWLREWFPDCNYWGEKKNVAAYIPKEFKVLPYSTIETLALSNLLKKVHVKLAEVLK